MGTAFVTIKVMPDSPSSDLDLITKDSEKIIEKHQGKMIKTETQPVAFGLKAILLVFSINENLELDPIEQDIQKITSVSSASVTDMRRSM